MDGVGDGRRGRARGGLSGAQERVARAVDQHGLDLGHVVETQDRIGFPVAAGDAAAVVGDLLVKRPTRGLDQPALELRLQPGRVDNLAGDPRYEETKQELDALRNAPEATILRNPFS